MLQKARKNFQAAVQPRQFGMFALLASIVLFGGKAAISADSRFEKWSLRPLCALWDGQASEAIARRVIESSPRDIDLRPLGDDLFRMQRARRSCDLGQIRTACQDYIAIMRNVRGTAADWRGSSSVCPAAIADEPQGRPQQIEAASE